MTRDDDNPTPNAQGAKPGRKAPPDWERIEFERARILSDGRQPRGSEKRLVQLFCELIDSGRYDERLPMSPQDTLVLEQAFRFGRADVVIYHVDGSVSVVEAKNGDVGYSHVLAGIGQLTMYAVQIANRKTGISKVNRCLLWSGASSIEADAMIEAACEQAGIIPLPMPKMSVITSTREAVRCIVEEESDRGRKTTD